MTLSIVLATHNRHKVEEVGCILADAVSGVTIDGYDGPEPVEDGVTFEQNALIKARAAGAATGRAALADDSGVCVDVLGGAPGVFSARWAGRHGDDAANLELLLAQLEEVAEPHRGAHFVCCLALVLPDGREWTVRGRWSGRLATSPLGEHGFGYDPVFVPDGETRSAAQLDPDEKNESSHRARALRAIVPILHELADS